MARKKQEQSSEIVAPTLTESAFVSELKRVIETFLEDEGTVSAAMKDRDNKIKELQREQGEDASNLIRLRGALSALAHMKKFCQNIETPRAANP